MSTESLDSAGIRRAREDVSRVAARMVRTGLVINASGNLSVRVDGAVVISPRGAELESLAPEDCAVVSAAGDSLTDAQPSSETLMHLAVYAETGAAAALHTHSPASVAFTTVRDELPAIHYSMHVLGDTIRVAPYETFGTPALASGAATGIRDRTAVLLRNHGAIVVGDTLAQALQRCLLLEWLCDVYLRALAVGSPTLLSSEQLSEVRARTPQSYDELLASYRAEP